MLTYEQKDNLIHKYYNNCASYMRNFVNSIIKKSGINIPQKDYDDIYSYAGEIFLSALDKFDNNKSDCQSFDVYLKTIMSQRLIDWYRSEYGRGYVKFLKDTISFDAPISGDGDDDAVYLADIIPQPEYDDWEISDGTKKYLSVLPEKNRELCELIMIGYDKPDICGMMEISKADYSAYIKECRKFQYIKYLDIL